MTIRERKGLRITLIKMDILMADIHRIWSSVQSPYAVPKRKLGEARSILISDPKRAYKLMCKARKDMVEESKAAQEYNHYRAVIPQINDSVVRDLDSRYKDCLEKGDYKAARNVAIKLSRTDAVIRARHSVTIKLTSSDATSLTYALENNSIQDMTIRILKITDGQMEMESDMRYPFIIRRNTRTEVVFRHDWPVSDTVQVYLEYTDDGIVKTHSFETVTNSRL